MNTNWKGKKETKPNKAWEKIVKSYWMSKTFSNCSFRNCISALKLASKSIIKPLEIWINACNICFNVFKKA